MRVFLNNVKELVITSGYQEIDSVHHTPHTGIDIAFNTGDPILSPVSGIVSRVVDYGSENIGRGIFIKLQNGQELIFGHLSRVCISEGQSVAIGQKIAEAGSTGFSTGSHLHLGCKFNGHFINPSHYVDLMQQVYYNHIHHITQYASDVATNKSHLYNAVSGIIQAFTN